MLYTIIYYGMSFFVFAMASWHYFLNNRRNTLKKLGLAFLGGFLSSDLLPVTTCLVVGAFFRNFLPHTDSIIIYMTILASIGAIYLFLVRVYARILQIRHRILVLILYSSLTLISNITNTMLPNMDTPSYILLSVFLNYFFVIACFLFKHRDFEELIENMRHLEKVNTRMLSIMIYLLTMLTYMYGIGVTMYRAIHNLTTWDDLQIGITFSSVFSLLIAFAFIKTMLQQANGSIENKRLFQATREANQNVLHTQEQMLNSQENVITAFANILENKSPENGGHVKRVALYSEVLAKEIGLSAETAKTIRIASMMHDVGKVLIPNEILEKKGNFTDNEYNIMKRHVLYGDHILKSTSGKLLNTARNIAREHHERWDGKGYMLGLKGDQISIEAQIVAVADVFDALTSRRSYKYAWDPRDAFAEILHGRGTQFSPRVVDAFMRSAIEFRKIHLSFPDNTGEPEPEHSADSRQNAWMTALSECRNIMDKGTDAS